MPFLEAKKELAQKLAGVFNHPELTAEKFLGDFSAPPNLKLGHLALPCFTLSKTFKKAPPAIIADITAKLSDDKITVTAAGPYANFKWNPHYLFQTTIGAIAKEKDNYGKDTVGKGKSILFEYCSPNIAKKLAFHHIRSTLIGHVLANIYQALGYELIRMNFVGDWGAQFARLLASVELWGDFGKIKADNLTEAMDILVKCYVKFHQEYDQKPELIEAANSALQKLENHDEKATAHWKQIRDVSIVAMQKTLDRLGVKFDVVEGESKYVPDLAVMLEEVKKKAQAKMSDGAWIVEVEGYETPALIQKRDGTTLYLTRDIAAMIDREKRFHFEKMFYVVSEQQKLHFQLLFGTVKKMGYAWASKCEHLGFGTVLFGSSKMSTREGKVALLDELLEQAHALALTACTEKNPDLPNKEEVAELIGIGAVIFGQMSFHRTRDIDFDWKKILTFEGETGPYVQYSTVRCKSLLKKATDAGETITLGDCPKEYAFAEEEEALILLLSQYRAVLHDILRDNEPYHLTHYLIDLTRAFNRFYYQLPVLQAEQAVQKKVRLQLVAASHQVLVNGLGLLGIRCPQEM